MIQWRYKLDSESVKTFRQWRWFVKNNPKKYRIRMHKTEIPEAVIFTFEEFMWGTRFYQNPLFGVETVYDGMWQDWTIIEQTPRYCLSDYA